MNLTKLVCSCFNTEVGSDEYHHVFIYSVSYLSGGYTAFEFQKMVKPFCVDMSAKAFRLKLFSIKRIHFGLKLMLLKLSRKPDSTFGDYKRIVETTDVDPEDAKQAYRIWREQEQFRKRLARQARRIARVTSITERSVRDQFERIHDDVERYVKFLTYKKLRFISSSNNMDWRDITGEIMLKVVHALYRICPTDKSDAYVTNYLKRVAHNHAMNMIKAYTTHKRGRLVQVGTTAKGLPIFSLSVVSENQITAVNESGEPIAYDELGERHNPMDEFELSFSVTQVLNRYRATARKYKFLRLLMGHDDKEFTEWLHQNGLAKRDDTNSDVQLRVDSEAYLSMVCRYLCVKREKAKVFLLKVKNELGLSHDYYDEQQAA